MQMQPDSLNMREASLSHEGSKIKSIEQEHVLHPGFYMHLYLASCHKEEDGIVSRLTHSSLLQPLD